MKSIRYKLESGLTKVIECQDADLPSVVELALAEAVDGEYTVEGIPEKVSTPTKMDRLEAQLTYTAMMTDTLLEA